MFSSVKKINQCCSEILDQVRENNYKVIRIKNRLKGKTSDLVINFLIGKTICELQFGIEFAVTDNEFNHKIYELLRSKFFSPLMMLKKLN